MPVPRPLILPLYPAKPFAFPSSPWPLAVTITHAHHILGGAAPGAHRTRGSELCPSHRQLLRQLVPDASKQRLMENTEDWRPRPGTGQSRSFRILAHLTGTEFSKCWPRVRADSPGLSLGLTLPGLKAGVTLLSLGQCLPLSSQCKTRMRNS